MVIHKSSSKSRVWAAGTRGETPTRDTPQKNPPVDGIFPDVKLLYITGASYILCGFTPQQKRRSIGPRWGDDAPSAPSVSPLLYLGPLNGMHACKQGGRNQDRWRVHFPVKWVFAKDLPNQQLKHITLPNNHNKPVAAAKDAQVWWTEGGGSVVLPGGYVCTRDVLLLWCRCECVSVLLCFAEL